MKLYAFYINFFHRTQCFYSVLSDVLKHQFTSGKIPVAKFKVHTFQKFVTRKEVLCYAMWRASTSMSVASRIASCCVRYFGSNSMRDVYISLCSDSNKMFSILNSLSN
jgi:hypothetical protein